jgi:CRISPR-associated protein Cas1
MGRSGMKILFLSGYGIDPSVDSGRLEIKDGRDLNKEPKEIVLKPKGDDYDGIVIYGHSGNVSLEAMRWLSKQNIPLTVLNWDGRMLVNILIPEMKQGVIRMA